MTTAITAVVIVVGLIGIVLPVLPGLLLVWAAIGVWALQQQSTTGWVVLGIATILYALGLLVQYLVPGRRMKRAGVRTSTLIIGVVAAIIGFFVVPVIGLFLGFPVGVYLAERFRRGSHADSWGATKHALRAVGLNILIELSTGMAITATWAIGVLTLAWG